MKCIKPKLKIKFSWNIFFNSLRRLTSFQDKINRPNSCLQAEIEGKLTELMSNVDSNAYNQGAMSGK